MSSKETLEIIQGISQIVGNCFDGSLDEDGKPLNIGLQREKGNPIIDSRLIDGFGVKFRGNKLCIKYQSDIRIKDVHDKKFESRIEDMIEDVVSFIKKECQKLTEKSLKLTPVKNSFHVIIQSTSNVRSWVEAQKEYEIDGVDSIDNKINKS